LSCVSIPYSYAPMPWALATGEPASPYRNCLYGKSPYPYIDRYTDRKNDRLATGCTRWATSRLAPVAPASRRARLPHRGNTPPRHLLRGRARASWRLLPRPVPRSSQQMGLRPLPHTEVSTSGRSGFREPVHRRRRAGRIVQTAALLVQGWSICGAQSARGVGRLRQRVAVAPGTRVASHRSA
jgi:hypothetical protein